MLRKCAWITDSTSFAAGCCKRHPPRLSSVSPFSRTSVTSTIPTWFPFGLKPTLGGEFFVAPGPNANSILFLYRKVCGAGNVGRMRVSSREVWELEASSFFVSTTSFSVTFAVRFKTSNTCCRFMSSCAGYDTSCQVHPPHVSKCGHGGDTACGDGTVAFSFVASANRPPFLTLVTFATTVSPGVARSHSTTNPSAKRHTPRPPNASAVHSTSTSSPTASGVELACAEDAEDAAREEAAAAALDCPSCDVHRIGTGRVRPRLPAVA